MARDSGRTITRLLFIELQQLQAQVNDSQVTLFISCASGVSDR